MNEQTTTRAEHMAWCKRRALAYLPDDPSNAIASLMSDMGKHPDTADSPMLMLTTMLMINGHLSTADQVRRHIEGFN